jgi:hypothetical protein
MHLSRRELLTAFLGAPFAAAACRQTPSSYPQGQIIGQSVELGHTIRQGLNLQVPAHNWGSRKVVIVGGGIAGLSAAWKLKNSGFHDFVLIELEKEVGGTSISGQGEPVPFPWAAHYLPVPFAENADLISLLEEMSLVEGRGPAGEVMVPEQYLCREPQERVFYKGRWYQGLYLHAGESQHEKLQFAVFQRKIDEWVNWRDAYGRRAFVVPVARSSSDAEVTSLDKISFADWLRQSGFTSERLLWYCDYACRDDYGLKLDQTSAWAGLFYFCSRVRKSGEDSQPFITFAEGNGRFVEHFRSRVRDHLRTGEAVITIIPVENGCEVVCLRDGVVAGIKCETVIYAAPVFTAPYVVRGLRADRPFLASEFQHNSWFVANLFLDERPKQRFARDFPLAWDNVIYESPSLGYVTATHQRGIDYGPTILTYYYPLCHEENGRAKLFDLTWRELADVCLSDLGRAHRDITKITTRIDIMRWGHAMISPRPNFMWSGVRERATAPYRSIHFAHSDLSGIALFEEAFYQGLRAANEVTIRS